MSSVSEITPPPVTWVFLSFTRHCACEMCKRWKRNRTVIFFFYSATGSLVTQTCIYRLKARKFRSERVTTHHLLKMCLFPLSCCWHPEFEYINKSNRANKNSSRFFFGVFLCAGDVKNKQTNCGSCVRASPVETCSNARQTPTATTANAAATAAGDKKAQTANMADWVAVERRGGGGGGGGGESCSFTSSSFPHCFTPHPVTRVYHTPKKEAFIFQNRQRMGSLVYE